jgi:hypothetical protein
LLALHMNLSSAMSLPPNHLLTFSGCSTLGPDNGLVINIAANGYCHPRLPPCRLYLFMYRIHIQ